MKNNRSKKLRMLLHSEQVLVNQGVSNYVSEKKLEKIKARLINLDNEIQKHKINKP